MAAESNGVKESPRQMITMKQEYVYFMKACGLVKIGYTNDLSGRLRSMNAHSPVKITIVRKFKTSYGCRDERFLHRLLAQHRVRGEWFRISDSQIRSSMRKLYLNRYGKENGRKRI